MKHAQEAKDRVETSWGYLKDVVSQRENIEEELRDLRYSSSEEVVSTRVEVQEELEQLYHARLER